jgi:hypothetical protein
MESILTNVNADRAAFNSLGNLYPADSRVEIFRETVEGVVCY